MKRIALTPTTAKMPISHSISNNRRGENANPGQLNKMPRITIVKTPARGAPAPAAATTVENQDLVLNQTLAKCVEEVSRVEHVNSRLQNQLFQQQEQIRLLQIEVAKQQQTVEESILVHQTNLKLQAKVLVLEKTCGNQEFVLVDMQKKYSVLEGYYNELLEFVEQHN
ncbi:hypothetical protein BASA81_005348 [Batrachochytrium salamandrivorans]|nr:hypothetical protein BASA81_005348 [Batrachochytrium salamandrivorans]